MNKSGKKIKLNINKILAWCLVFTLLFEVSGFTVNATELYVERKADVVFVIDATGSMGGCISSVKANITNFINMISKEDVDIRIKFVIYRDITCSEPTQASNWYSSTDSSSAYLTGVEAIGGGDEPETLLDGLGQMLSSGFREDAVKYCVAFTDAAIKTDNNYGYATEETAIGVVNAAGINMSMVTRSDLFESAAKYVSSDRGGILADIYGDYSILLKGLADTIIGELDGLSGLVMSPRNCKEGEDVTVRVTSSVEGGITYADDFTVLFDGESVEVISREVSYFEFKVPSDKIFGKYEVKTVNGGVQNMIGHFTIESAAEYGTMSPSSTTKGTEVTVRVLVSGLHYLSDFTVRAGGKRMSVSSKNDEYFEFSMSSGLDVNSYDITVTNGGQIEYIGEFIIEPKIPVFGAMDKTEGEEGTSAKVKVPVENMEYASDFAVMLNGTAVKVSPYASSFKFTVPSDMAVGSYAVTVINDGKTYDIGTYTVKAKVIPEPVFGAMDKTEGEEGISEKVEVPFENLIYASDFAVMLNGTVVKVSPYASSFKFTVPSDMAVGSYAVTVINNGKTYDIGTYTVKGKIIPEPVFGAMDKTEGEEGTSAGVKVPVENMSYESDFAVMLNGTAVKVSPYGTYFKFTVPSDTAVGSYAVTVINDGKTYDIGTYTVKAKVIPEPVFTMQLTESSAGTRKGVKVMYTNMSYASDFAVSMNGTNVKVSPYGSYFKFTVPSTLPAGSYTVTVTNNGKTYDIGTYTLK